MPLTHETKLEMSGIVNELIYAKSETFDPQAAKRLKDILLIDCELKKEQASFRYDFSSSFQKFQGYATGIGNLSLKNEEQKSISLGDKNKIFCGNWTIRLGFVWGRQSTYFTIDRKFDESRSFEDRESYQLRFQADEPTEFVKSSWGSTNLLIIKIGHARYRHFKSPAPVCTNG